LLQWNTFKPEIQKMHGSEATVQKKEDSLLQNQIIKLSQVQKKSQVSEDDLIPVDGTPHLALFVSTPMWTSSSSVALLRRTWSPSEYNR
jgi:hypothetical protein